MPKTTVLALCSFLSLTSIASANTIITLSATAQGWINNGPGINTPLSETPTATANYLVGQDAGDASAEFRDFFQFAIPTLSGTIISAELQINTGDYSSQDASETFQLTSLGASFGFADLGTGTVYGTQAFTSADANTVVDIDLDSAIADILSNTTFSTGGRITTLSGVAGFNEEIFSGTRGSNTKLVLTISDTDDTGSSVPEPATLALLGVGLAALYKSRRAA